MYVLSAEENIANAIREDILAELASAPEAPTAFYQTPIERWFFQAFMLATRRSGVEWGLVSLGPGDRKGAGHLKFTPQAFVLDWPVDYLIEVETDDGVRKLAIECDGHDFHERTKEQAARDRSRDRELQERGVIIFRITGSELYRSAWRCAVQAVEWAERSYLGLGMSL